MQLQLLLQLMWLLLWRLLLLLLQVFLLLLQHSKVFLLVLDVLGQHLEHPKIVAHDLCLLVQKRALFFKKMLA